MKQVQRFLIIIEQAGGNYSAYSPDLSGCVATGDTKEEVIQRMREAITFHLDGLREDGMPVPAPQSSAEYVTISESL